MIIETDNQSKLVESRKNKDEPFTIKNLLFRGYRV